MPKERRLVDQRALGRGWVEMARATGDSPSARRMLHARPLARVRQQCDPQVARRPPARLPDDSARQWLSQARERRTQALARWSPQGEALKESDRALSLNSGQAHAVQEQPAVPANPCATQLHPSRLEKPSNCSSRKQGSYAILRAMKRTPARRQLGPLAPTPGYPVPRGTSRSGAGGRAAWASGTPGRTRPVLPARGWRTAHGVAGASVASVA
jgi:hypothetical protein